MQRGRGPLLKGSERVSAGPHQAPHPNQEKIRRPVNLADPGPPSGHSWGRRPRKGRAGGQGGGRRVAPVAVSRAENETQSHQTSMGENFQRSGWPMCSRPLNGEELHWNGGSWSHVGPLTATI